MCRGSQKNPQYKRYCAIDKTWPHPITSPSTFQSFFVYHTSNGGLLKAEVQSLFRLSFFHIRRYFTVYKLLQTLSNRGRGCNLFVFWGSTSIFLSVYERIPWENAIRTQAGFSFIFLPQLAFTMTKAVTAQRTGSGNLRHRGSLSPDVRKGKRWLVICTMLS